jgi:hypothetical protein
MAGLGPAIHVFSSGRNVDDRIKSGHDGLELNGPDHMSPRAHPGFPKA